ASCDITARMSVTAACGCCWAGSRDVSCAAGQQRPEEAVTDLDRYGGIRSRSLILSCHDKEDAERLLHVAAQPPRTRHGTPASPQVNTQTVTVVPAINLLGEEIPKLRSSLRPKPQRHTGPPLPASPE